MLIDRGSFQTWLCSLSNCVVGVLCYLGIWSFAWIKKVIECMDCIDKAEASFHIGSVFAVYICL